MRCQKKEKNEVYNSTELYRIPVESSGLSNNPSNDVNQNPMVMDGRNEVVFLPPSYMDGSSLLFGFIIQRLSIYSME